MTTATFSGILACAAFLVFLLIVFGFLAFWRYMQYRETVVLAEKGLVRPTSVSGNDSAALRWGIVIAAIGLALSIGLYPVGFMIDARTSTFPLRFGPWMLIGIIPLFFGLALVLIHIVTRQVNPKPGMETMHPRGSEATPEEEGARKAG